MPARIVFPAASARTPRPATISNRSGASYKMPSSFAFSTTAAANGCSLPDSAHAASARNSRSATPEARTIISVTAGWPEVMVPVLSKTTVSTVCKFSRLSADFIRIPYSAAFPVPTIIATGVARPSAHGQEITSTETAQLSANSKLSPANIHTAPASTAMPITTGTNTPLILSASRAIGALVLPASSTRRMIRASVVSSPTREARKRNVPFLLIVAEMTVSPAPFSTGMLSPVMAA